MAKITTKQNLWIVTWKNLGSDLRPLPRAFTTREAAENFCRNSHLSIVR